MLNTNHCFNHNPKRMRRRANKVAGLGKTCFEFKVTFTIVSILSSETAFLQTSKAILDPENQSSRHFYWITLETEEDECGEKRYKVLYHFFHFNHPETITPSSAFRSLLQQVLW